MVFCQYLLSFISLLSTLSNCAETRKLKIKIQGSLSNCTQPK
jgi:hypothetical protein